MKKQRSDRVLWAAPVLSWKSFVGMGIQDRPVPPAEMVKKRMHDVLLKQTAQKKSSLGDVTPDSLKLSS